MASKHLALHLQRRNPRGAKALRLLEARNLLAMPVLTAVLMAVAEAVHMMLPIRILTPTLTKEKRKPMQTPMSTMRRCCLEATRRPAFAPNYIRPADRPP